MLNSDFLPAILHKVALFAFSPPALVAFMYSQYSPSQPEGFLFCP
jgi:hypothetical protein